MARYKCNYIYIASESKCTTPTNYITIIVITQLYNRYVITCVIFISNSLCLQVDLVMEYAHPDLGEYTSTPQWNLLSASATRTSVTYPCCNESYVDVTFVFSFQRHAAYSLHLFVAPSVTLSLFIPVVFVMPAGSTEKISLGR